MLTSSTSLVSGLCAFSAMAQSRRVARVVGPPAHAARAVLEQENLRQAVLAALAKPESQIVIHRGTAQEFLLQAEGLRSWLGALAIEPRRVVLPSDLTAEGTLKIEVVP
jgi:hypothetical protein